MKQRVGGLLLGGVFVLLSGCSDDDGSDVVAKDPNGQAASGGGGAGGVAGAAGGGAGGGAGSGGNGGSGGLDAGMEDTCTPVFLDAGVVSDAGPEPDAGDAGAVSPNGPVTFAADIYPILRANCVPCHETQFFGGHNVADADVNVAYGFVNALKPSLVERVSGGNMPMPPSCDGVPGDPGCISVAELDLMVRWAAQCFPP